MPLRAIVRFILGANALALATIASAQTSPSPQDDSSSSSSGELETIIVTANKVAEPVQKVAATVNVVSAAMLEDLHIQTEQEIGTLGGGLS